MANLSNINNKFLFTDGDFLKIGNLAPINNISGTESGISITNGNCASITLDNSAAQGKTFSIYSAVNGSLNFFDVDASSARLVINSAGNATFAGSISAGGISITTLTAANIQLNGSFTVLNKAQTSYLPFATRNTTGSEVVYDLTNAGNATFAGNLIFASGTYLTDISSNYVNLHYASSSAGGFLISNSNGTQGYIYADGATTSNSFGLLDGSGSWAVRCKEAAGVELYYSTDNSLKFETTSTGVTVTGALFVNTGDASGNRMGLKGDGATTGTALHTNWTTGNSYLDFRLGGDTDTYTKMRITNTGNVGIGTTSPGTKLEVVETAANTDCVVRIKGPRDAYLQFSPANTTKWALIADYPALGDFTTYNYPNNFNSIIFKDNKDITTNLSGGNFGIGVTSPTYKLQVAGTTLISGGLKVIGPGSYNTFQSGNDYILGLNDYNSVSQWWLKAYTTGDFALHENTQGDKFTIKAGGDVGINITNPQAKLHVNGGAIISTTRYGDFAVASINTTGYAIANVAASTNGQSSIVEFVASGGAGAYYNVVYSIYNGGGLWYYTKNVVGSGGNIEVAETNGSGSSTLIFYFRATSGTQAYTPRVMMKASPYNYVTF